MLDISSLAKEQTIRITDIFIDKTEALTEVLKEKARELEALRMDSVKQELDTMNCLDLMMKANQMHTESIENECFGDMQ